jgi:tRNA threonylcarbamoyladenosine biosynthesis protein TsaB
MLLAIDTSTLWIGLALYDGNEVLGESSWQSSSHHTIELAPAVHEMLRRCSVKPDNLQAIGVALGPGSFTALRIGLAVAKGLSLGLYIPMIGIPTLDIIAASQPVEDKPMAAVLRAGRGRLAVTWYKAKDGKWVSNGAPQVSTVEELAEKIHQPTLICGELSKKDRAVLGRKWKNAVVVSPVLCVRRPAVLADLAWQRFQAKQFDNVPALAPIYLHIGETIPNQ